MNTRRHPAPRKLQYGDPFAEQRALESGRVTALGTPIGLWAYDAVRIAHGVPATKAELEVAHDQRLVLLHLDGVEQVLPEPGADLYLVYPPMPNPVAVGTVTTAAWHYELGPIALAVVDKVVQQNDPLYIGYTSEGTEVRVAASLTAIAEIAANP